MIQSTNWMIRGFVHFLFIFTQEKLYCFLLFNSLRPSLFPCKHFVVFKYFITFSLLFSMIVILFLWQRKHTHTHRSRKARLRRIPGKYIDMETVIIDFLLGAPALRLNIRPPTTGIMFSAGNHKRGLKMKNKFREVKKRTDTKQKMLKTTTKKKLSYN